MPTQPKVSDNAEVQEHYATQVALTAALFAALRRAWPTLDLTDLAASLPRFKAVVAALVNQFSLASASMGVDFYEAMRAQTGITAAFATPMVGPPVDAQVGASLDWAVSGLLDLGRGVPQDLHPALTYDLVTGVRENVEAVSQKLVADTGRKELVIAARADRTARAWARVTRPGACSFCRMLATRGAVFKSEQSAGREANARFVGEDEFKFHDNCHCTIEPVFGQYEPPAHTRADQALWKEVTRGLHGAAARKAFRRAVEGRSDGPTRDGKKGAVKKAPDLGFSSLTPDQLRHQLDVLEQLKDSDYRTAQMKRVRDRLAVLTAKTTR